MTSWLGDQTEKVIVSIPHHAKDTVKISRFSSFNLFSFPNINNTDEHIDMSIIYFNN